MADVVMSDAPAGSNKAVEGKKKFEVKKVSVDSVNALLWLLTIIVECCGSLGMGYCR